MSKKYFLTLAFALLILSALTLLTQGGCSSDKSTNNTGTAYQEANFVADTSSFTGARIDASLVNAWGIAIGPTGTFWISSNHGGVSTVYDKAGAQKLAAVTIPSKDANTGGAPTGVIYNSTTDFVMTSNGQPSKFIFAGEDGIIAAWNAGSAAIKVADRSSTEAVYKGLAAGSSGGNNYLYVANFKGQKIDVFDKNFAYVSTMPFSDPNIPAGFGPFNVQNIGGYLYVTYAKLLAPDFEDDEAGPGNGFVDIFNTDGTLSGRFAAQGHLNSPWGVVTAPAGFGQFANDILIGNFGDGTINAFDAAGNFKGQLKDKSNQVISIEGLWGLFFYTDAALGDVNTLYFTAGPFEEDHGLFGVVK
jgi:uncharacterized protein (TIGR03118 family)